MDDLWQQINRMIHERDTQTTQKLILKYLKIHRSSPKALYEASEFFRKISDYTRALYLLPKETASSLSAKQSDIEIKLYLQLARILNLLGASQYAMRMVNRFREAQKIKSKIEIIGIYISNYKYAEALDLLGSDHPLPQSDPWHQDWLLHFYRADALSGLKRWDEAINIAHHIYENSKSPLIRAIAMSSKGEYLTKAGEPKAGLPVFLEAKKFFKANDRTADNGFLHRRLGVCYFQLGNYVKAESALRKAFEIFYRPGLKPEPWLETILWLDRLPRYQNKSQQMAPRLWALSGSGHPLLKKLDLCNAGNEDDILSIAHIEHGKKQTHLDRVSDVIWHGSKATLGLDRTDELIYTLIYTGKLGVPQYRLYEILWPDELFSFDSHQKRLEQLVIRARSKGYKIIWKDLHLSLESKDVTASSRPKEVIRGHSFLAETKVFTRNDVQKYFSLSRSVAIRLCKYWLESDLIESVDNSQFRVTIF